MSERQKKLLTLILLNELLYSEQTEEVEEEKSEKPPPKTAKKRKRPWLKEYSPKRGNMSAWKESKVGPPEEFKLFLRMSEETYALLLEKVKPRITKVDTLMRDAISPNERLSATLQYLASGNSFENLKLLTGISSQALGKIVIETCEAIIHVLRDRIRTPKTEEEWLKIAKGFEDMWSFPNCIGALQAKHIGIRKPSADYPLYVNYKKNFSIVLLALVNNEYDFIMVEAGVNGKLSKDGIFSQSSFCGKFDRKELKIPGRKRLPHSSRKTPHLFVTGDGFPLKQGMMKPYTGDSLNYHQKIFNYRLTRARRTAENAFGVLSSRFRVLLNTMNLSPEKCATISLTCCFLHNFLKQSNPSQYLWGSVDVENLFFGEIREGCWRNRKIQLLDLEPSEVASESAEKVRHDLCRFFNKEGAVAWQDRFVEKE